MTVSPPARGGRGPLDVLVVDDSALMRRYIRQSLEEAGHRVRLARDGSEALLAVARQKPDVVTMDVDMPKMDGLTCLSHLMVEAPVPVVMVSSLTARGTKIATEALKMGAVDIIPKPGGGLSRSILKIKSELVSRVERAAQTVVRRRLRRTVPSELIQQADSHGMGHPSRPMLPGRSPIAASRPRPSSVQRGARALEPRTSPLEPRTLPLEPRTRPLSAGVESRSSSLRPIVEGSTRPLEPRTRPLSAGVESRSSSLRPALAAPLSGGLPLGRAATRRSTQLVLVGVSTGGPATLEAILSKLPASYAAPILVAQHMPENFTGLFAKRLGRHCSLDVVEVTGSAVLVKGTVYIARGGHDVVVRASHGRLIATSVENDPRRSWHPSVGRMVASALAAVPASCLVGLQLTGMGDDGAAEMAELKSRGGRTIAQSEESCAVYGMPRALVMRKGATSVLSEDLIAPRLRAWE